MQEGRPRCCCCTPLPARVRPQPNSAARAGKPTSLVCAAHLLLPLQRYRQADLNPAPKCLL